MYAENIKHFVDESNKIENIEREPTLEELYEFSRFIELERVTIEDLEHFVSVYQPNAKLRDHYGLDVRVGSYIPPLGGPEIRTHLQRILDTELSSYDLHIIYEQLHPFTDGNGRSGRALWAWKEGIVNDGFLRPFYYQTLQNADNNEM